MIPGDLQDESLDFFLTETQARLVELNIKAEQTL
jgi:hypothetical protein